jgi:hypothetical protein
MTYGSLKEKIKAEGAVRREKYAEFDALFAKAHEAGVAAGTASTPTPMIVGQAKSLFSTEIDMSQKTYFVEDGVCGFAWVHFSDARVPFVRWAKSQKKGHSGYPKGWDISCRDFNQSMQRKEAYCAAFAKVMREAGIDCYAQSRMD